jgi:hypothetical protein
LKKIDIKYQKFQMEEMDNNLWIDPTIWLKLNCWTSWWHAWNSSHGWKWTIKLTIMTWNNFYHIKAWTVMNKFESIELVMNSIHAQCFTCLSIFHCWDSSSYMCFISSMLSNFVHLTILRKLLSLVYLFLFKNLKIIFLVINFMHSNSNDDELSQLV